MSCKLSVTPLKTMSFLFHCSRDSLFIFWVLQFHCGGFIHTTCLGFLRFLDSVGWCISSVLKNFIPNVSAQPSFWVGQNLLPYLLLGRYCLCPTFFLFSFWDFNLMFVKILDLSSMSFFLFRSFVFWCYIMGMFILKSVFLCTHSCHMWLF